MSRNTYHYYNDRRQHMEHRRTELAMPATHAMTAAPKAHPCDKPTPAPDLKKPAPRRVFFALGCPATERQGAP